MKTVNGALNITCLMTCPNCDNVFDLFEIESLTESGYIYQELLPSNEYWGKENWGEDVYCPECKEGMVIGRIEW